MYYQRYPFHDTGRHPYICDFLSCYICLALVFLSLAFSFLLFLASLGSPDCHYASCLGVRYSIPPSSSKRFSQAFLKFDIPGMQHVFAEWWFFFLVFFVFVFQGPSLAFSLVIDVW